MLQSRWRSLVLTLVCVLLLGACKLKPGAKCTGAGLPSCSDPGTALVCTNGVVTAQACRGPKACTSTAQQVQCDNSLSLAGDTCDQPGDVACAVDHKSALECQNGKFAVAETCRGARACGVEGDKISCDNDVADLGDLCRVESDYACTTNKLMALKCVAHKFQELNSCRGKDGCRVFELPEEKKTDFVCDDALAQENDPCDTETEEACSMDKAEILVCKGGHFAKDHACSGGCSFDEKGEKFECAGAAPGAAKAKAPATAKGATAATRAAPATKAAPAAKAALASKAAAKPPPAAAKKAH